MLQLIFIFYFGEAFIYIILLTINYMKQFRSCDVYLIGWHWHSSFCDQKWLKVTKCRVIALFLKTPVVFTGSFFLMFLTSFFSCEKRIAQCYLKAIILCFNQMCPWLKYFFKTEKSQYHIQNVKGIKLIFSTMQI